MPTQAPSRPALLVIDPDDARRHALAVTLYAQGYESVPTTSAEQGLLYARTLGPAVVVAPLGLPGFDDGAALPETATGETAARTLLLFGATAEDGEELPEDVLYLAIGGLSGEELAGRVRLVLVGREIGVGPDAELTALVGDLSQVPLLELVRALGRIGGSGSIELERGSRVDLALGRVVAASSGAAHGVKAFCRLARRRAGPFRLRLDLPAVEPGDPSAVHEELTPLVIEALEDVVAAPPDGRLRVRRTGMPRTADDVTRGILSLVDLARAEGQEIAVAAVLDRLPFKDGQIEAKLLALRDDGAIELVEPQAAVRIVTDSTADLPPDLARAHGIHVVPLRVYFGQTTFRDGVDIAPKSFYELLQRSTNVHPHTSPPPQEEFLSAYRALLGKADVVSVHISAKMSLTSAEASQALAGGVGALAALRRDGSIPRVDVVDSRSVSLGLGLQALFAARMAERGLDAAAISERLTSIRDRVHALFIVDTLEYLARGGRIGKARAVLGGLLGIKPILGVVGGEVTAVDRVRGGRRAHPKILELFMGRVDPKRPVLGGVVHANAPMWAERLRGLLADNLDMRELLMAEIGPVVGTHAGPGTVGAALFQPQDDEELALLSPPEG